MKFRKALIASALLSLTLGACDYLNSDNEQSSVQQSSSSAATTSSAASSATSAASSANSSSISSHNSVQSLSSSLSSSIHEHNFVKNEETLEYVCECGEHNGRDYELTITVPTEVYVGDSLFRRDFEYSFKNDDGNLLFSCVAYGNYFNKPNDAVITEGLVGQTIRGYIYVGVRDNSKMRFSSDRGHLENLTVICNGQVVAPELSTYDFSGQLYDDPSNPVIGHRFFNYNITVGPVLPKPHEHNFVKNEETLEYVCSECGAHNGRDYELSVTIPQVHAGDVFDAHNYEHSFKNDDEALVFAFVSYSIGRKIIATNLQGDDYYFEEEDVGQDVTAHIYLGVHDETNVRYLEDKKEIENAVVYCNGELALKEGNMNGSFDYDYATQPSLVNSKFYHYELNIGALLPNPNPQHVHNFVRDEETLEYVCECGEHNGRDYEMNITLPDIHVGDHFEEHNYEYTFKNDDNALILAFVSYSIGDDIISTSFLDSSYCFEEKYLGQDVTAYIYLAVHDETNVRYSEDVHELIENVEVFCNGQTTTGYGSVNGGGWPYDRNTQPSIVQYHFYPFEYELGTVLPQPQHEHNYVRDEETLEYVCECGEHNGRDYEMNITIPEFHAGETFKFDDLVYSFKNDDGALDYGVVSYRVDGVLYNVFDDTKDEVIAADKVGKTITAHIYVGVLDETNIMYGEDANGYKIVENLDVFCNDEQCDKLAYMVITGTSAINNRYYHYQVDIGTVLAAR